MGAADFVRLTKPGVTALVVATCVAGWWIAPGEPSAVRAIATAAGTGLLVASANAINMWLERDLDAKMDRTKGRPLAAGRLSTRAALVFAGACALLGGATLVAVEPAAALLGAAALLIYTCVYTPLKPRSCIALGIGAIPGALPPVMGWTARAGNVGGGAALLFVILFLWQFVHAGAIGVFRGKEYAAAGMKVVAVERGETAARALVAVHAGMLVGVTLVAPFAGLGDGWSGIAAAVLGGGLLAVVLRRSRDSCAWSRRVFAASNVYLALWLGALVVARR